MGKKSETFFLISIVFININETAWETCLKKKNKKVSTGYQENRVAFLSGSNSPMTKSNCFKNEKSYFLWFECLSHLICRNPRFHSRIILTYAFFFSFDTEKGILHCLAQYLNSMPTAAAESWKTLRVMTFP